MVYSIVFISTQKLRDSKLDVLLNGGLGGLYVGEFDYILRVKSGQFEAWNYNLYRDRSIIKCAKWKSIKGPDASIIKLRNLIKDRKRIRVIGNNSDMWDKGEYTPVICDITNIWNLKIDDLILESKRTHLKKLELLEKKRSKFFN